MEQYLQNIDCKLPRTANPGVEKIKGRLSGPAEIDGKSYALRCNWGFGARQYSDCR